MLGCKNVRSLGAGGGGGVRKSSNDLGVKRVKG